MEAKCSLLRRNKDRQRDRKVTVKYLLQHLFCGIQFLSVFLQTELQIPNLFSLGLHLIRKHTYLYRGDKGMHISTSHPYSMCHLKNCM